MKDKLNKKKKMKDEDHFNDSSSTIVEPSFSKITFRKRGHNSSLRMSDISEKEEEMKEDICKEEDGTKERLNQSKFECTNTDYTKKKKKRHKENPTDMCEKEDGTKGELNQSNLSCRSTDYNKKKKRNKENASDMCEEEDGTKEELYQSNLSCNSIEYPKKKKKRNKEKLSSEMCEQEERTKEEINPSSLSCTNIKYFKMKKKSSKGKLSDINEEKNGSKQKLNQSNLSYDDIEYKCEKKKKRTKETPVLESFKDSPTKEHKISKESLAFNDDKHIGLGKELGLNCSFDSTNQNVHKKKRKKKVKSRIFEDPLGELNFNEEAGSANNEISKRFEDKTEPKFGINLFSPRKGDTKKKQLGFTEDKPRTFHHQETLSDPEKSLTKFNSEEINKFDVVLNSPKNITSQELSESIKTSPSGTFRKNKKSKSSMENVFEAIECTDSPLLHKKKKIQRLIDESIFNVSESNHMYDDRSASCSVAEDSSDLNTPHPIHSEKNKKRKLSNDNLKSKNTTIITAINNHGRVSTKSADSDKSLRTNTNKKDDHEILPSEVKPSSAIMVKENSINLLPLDSNVIQQGHDTENEYKESCLSRINEIVKQKQDIISTPSVSFKSDNLVASKPSKMKHANKSKAKGKVHDLQSVPSLTKKKKKKKNKIDISTLKKQLLKEAFTGTEESEDLDHKSTKTNKKNENLVETLRMKLLKETVSEMEKSHNRLKKSITPESVNENVDTLRTQLLKQAFSNKELSSKVTKNKKEIKMGVKHKFDTKVLKSKKGLHQDGRDQMKQKIKRNPKVKKSDDIDKLTDLLLSRALEKVSSSSASHSSQVNIDVLNVEEKAAYPKKQVSSTESKTLKEKQHKNHHSKRKIDVQQDKSDHQSEIDQIQTSLLNDAMKSLMPKCKTSLKNKDKVKTQNSKEFDTSKQLSRMKKV